MQVPSLSRLKRDDRKTKTRWVEISGPQRYVLVNGSYRIALTTSQVFNDSLEQIIMAINDEDEFTTEFLQINDAGLTFADYMGLDNYFRRQAARSASLKQSTLKLVRGALDLIFGFLPAEMKNWLDAAISKDRMQVLVVTASFSLPDVLVGSLLA